MTGVLGMGASGDPSPKPSGSHGRLSVRVGRDVTLGWVILVGCLGVGVFLAVRDPGLGGARTGLIAWAFAWGAWVVFVRPRIEVWDSSVVLINSLRDVTIPAASITGVEVGRYLQIGAAGRTYTSAAVGEKRRRRRRPTEPEESVQPYRGDDAGLVREAVRAVIAHAVPRSGSVESVSVRWAKLPLAVLAILCAGGVLAYAL